jgi:CP12 domain
LKGETIMSQTVEAAQALVTSDSSAAKTLVEAIAEAVAEARTACELSGSNSSECAVAWDIVEELQAEKSHQQQATKTKTSLEQYCNEHPEAIECRVYDI